MNYGYGHMASPGRENNFCSVFFWKYVISQNDRLFVIIRDEASMYCLMHMTKMYICSLLNSGS
jgi:hypothetical protein